MQVEHIRPVRNVKKRLSEDEGPQLPSLEEITESNQTEDVFKAFFSELLQSNRSIYFSGFHISPYKPRHYNTSPLVSDAMYRKLVRLQEYLPLIQDPDSSDERMYGVNAYTIQNN